MDLQEKRENREAIYRIDTKIEEIITKRFTARLLAVTYGSMAMVAAGCCVYIAHICGMY